MQRRVTSFLKLPRMPRAPDIGFHDKLVGNPRFQPEHSGHPHVVHSHEACTFRLPPYFGDGVHPGRVKTPQTRSGPRFAVVLFVRNVVLVCWIPVNFTVRHAVKADEGKCRMFLAGHGRCGVSNSLVHICQINQEVVVGR